MVYDEKKKRNVTYESKQEYTQYESFNDEYTFRAILYKITV